ncbi:MAG: lytic transglycosylase domain-containing protein [Lachnospiraceae bacterium]|nr:lytic transglycosylase domain-containing protein [Lachnospiraceae bacterium]
MIYINGLGLIDETNSITPVAKTTETTAEQAVSFDEVLEQEAAKLNGSSSYDLNAIFKAAAEKYGLPESLLKSVAYTESGYDVNIGSPAGAQGIMQLMPFVSESMGVTDPYDPYQSIMAGAKILAGYRDMYDGNLNLMLAAYNAGAGNVAQYGGVPPFKETQTYVALVKKRMEEGVPEPGQVTLSGDSAAAMAEVFKAQEQKAVETVAPENTTLKDTTDTTDIAKAETAQAAATTGEAAKAAKAADTSEAEKIKKDTANAIKQAQDIIEQTRLNALSSITGSSDDSSLYPYSLFGTSASELAKLSSTLYTGSYVGNSQLSIDELNKALSDDEYQLLMYFYDNMLEIIASIGGSSEEEKNSSDNSLTDLIRLGNEYNRLKVNEV